MAFSGGKDSQALYHITELSGVKFGAHFSPTTVDPPTLIRFIRKNYPDVEFGKVEKNIYDLAVEKQILPTMRVRWCCAEFKEMAGAGKVTLIGIRHAESIRRSKRKEVEISNRKFSGNFEQFTKWQEEKIRKKYKNLNQDQFSYDQQQYVRCIGGKDSILVSPIIDWTERDVWEFLNKVCEVPHCELYDKGYHRIGCICCPMSSHRQKLKEIEDYPYVKAKWIDAIKKIRMGGYSKTNIYGGASGETIQQTALMGGGQQRRLLGNGRYGKDKAGTGTELISQVLNANGSKKHRNVGREVSLTVPAIPNSEELENQIAENIFDWWISGKAYEEWYADKFLQGKIEFNEEDE